MAQGRGPAERTTAALEAVDKSARSGVEIDLQGSLYVLGLDLPMDEICGCIAFLKARADSPLPR